MSNDFLPSLAHTCWFLSSNISNRALLENGLESYRDSSLYWSDSFASKFSNFFCYSRSYSFMYISMFFSNDSIPLMVSGLKWIEFKNLSANSRNISPLWRNSFLILLRTTYDNWCSNGSGNPFSTYPDFLNTIDSSSNLGSK